MGAIHFTPSGSCELLDSWGHGRAARGDWRRAPAVLIFDDGDGHYDAWRICGNMKEAARKLGQLHLSGGRFSREGVAIYHGGAVSIQEAPEGFWIESEDESIPDTAKFPEVVAW